MTIVNEALLVARSFMACSFVVTLHGQVRGSEKSRAIEEAVRRAW